MPDAEEYQKRADDCRREASAKKDLAEREALIRIAAQSYTVVSSERDRSCSSPIQPTVHDSITCQKILDEQLMTKEGSILAEYA